MVALRSSHAAARRKLEWLFFRWGRCVARHPWPVIAATLLLSAGCSAGMLLFKAQYATDKLWLPSTSRITENKEWTKENFKTGTRSSRLLFKGENVLSPEGLQQILQIHQGMAGFMALDKSWWDMCLRMPVGSIFHRGKNPRVWARTQETTAPPDLELSTTRSSNEDLYDYDDIWSDYSDEGRRGRALEGDRELLDSLPPDIFCDLVTTLDERCSEFSLLEIWDFREDVIATLTVEDILEAVNTLDKSPWFFLDRNYTSDLGGITKNSSGHVVAAETVVVNIIVEVPEDAVSVEVTGIGFEHEAVDETSLLFEQFLIDLCGNKTDSHGFQITLDTPRSFNDVSSEALFSDQWRLVAGYSLMFLYCTMVLGRITHLQVRVFLSLAGVASCVLGLAASYGLMFLLGLEYNQFHKVLPFIAIGIGIDDMFVLMECWRSLQAEPGDRSLEDRIGTVVSQAGVSICVTSLTDVLAFCLGATTIMPGLRSFCLTAAICIGFIFLLQVSWFVAWLTLDQKRLKSKRLGLAPCFTLKKEEVPKTDKRNSKVIFNGLAKLLEHIIFKVSVVAVTLVLLGFGLHGSTQILQRLDPLALLPTDSYLSKHISTSRQYYPQYNLPAEVITGSIQFEDLHKLDVMVTQLEQLTKPGPGRILSEMHSWWTDFSTFLDQQKSLSWRNITQQTQFQALLGDFLYDVEYARHRESFRFSGDLQCGVPAPPITASKQVLYFGLSSPLPLPEEYLPAKATLERIVQTADLSSRAFTTCPLYQAWETDSIIASELWRNLALALAAVGAVSLLMLGQARLTLMVMSCVLLTLVDLVACLHYWGVTIDVMSCINIVLATGLCVDYSAHIGHAFSVASGSSTERAQEALRTLGPAILNGGVTTLLAVILLPLSSSPVFHVFFKVFSLTVLFGCFHGLVFLPCLLSILGPSSPSPTPSTSSTSSPTSNSFPSSSVSPNSLQGCKNIGCSLEKE